MIQLNLQLSLYAVIILWSTKAPKHQDRIYHPWRYACQHLLVFYCMQAQPLPTKHKGPSSPHLFLDPSEKQSRTGIFDSTSDIRQVQRLLVPKAGRNEIKAKSVFSCVRLPILGGEGGVRCIVGEG